MKMRDFCNSLTATLDENDILKEQVNEWRRLLAPLLLKKSTRSKQALKDLNTILAYEPEWISFGEDEGKVCVFVSLNKDVDTRATPKVLAHVVRQIDFSY